MEYRVCKEDVPKHIGIIMDGNRRWAKEKKQMTIKGHKAGENTLRQTCIDCVDLGIKYLTVFAFSTDNWKRSYNEVHELMNLLKVIAKRVNEFIDNNVCIKFVGVKENLDKDILDVIKQLEEVTVNCYGLILTIAFNYGGKQEILNVINSIIKDKKSNKLEYEYITEEIIESYLYTKDLPEPEMIIRTGGEQRTSGFLLWKGSYSELMFLDKYWPDFNKEDLIQCINDYAGRTINRGQ